MKHLLSILALGAAVSAVAACSHEQTALSMPPGHYEKSTSYSDANGTDHDKKTSATVGYDANGNKEAVVSTKSTVDPPGLFNKRTSESTAVVK